MKTHILVRKIAFPSTSLNLHTEFLQTLGGIISIGSLFQGLGILNYILCLRRKNVSLRGATRNK